MIMRTVHLPGLVGRFACGRWRKSATTGTHKFADSGTIRRFGANTLQEYVDIKNTEPPDTRYDNDERVACEVCVKREPLIILAQTELE